MSYEIKTNHLKVTENCNLRLMGYLLAEEVIYCISNKTIFNTHGKFEADRLRKTLSLVLEYLLLNAKDKVVTDEELLSNIWDANGLCSSSQRLWQVMNNLKKNCSQWGYRMISFCVYQKVDI